jgi:ABC-type dipeptide/oligopeptide/nickel transport system ATPase component
MSILSVENLNLSFKTEDGYKQALYGVTFSLEAGKTLALVGESGCGKTMSAMSILNLIPKTAKITDGKIIYNNENLLEKTQAEKQKIRGGKIALIPQDPMTSLNPLYTVGDQLLEVIKIHQNLYGDKALKKAEEAFDSVQIPSAKERLKNYPHEFSGGMKQRAIIAMALACNAEIIIAD